MKSDEMIEKIRIYYESIEQGANYIKPMIEKSLNRAGLNTDIELVRLKGSHSYYSKNVAPIIFWKDPDILLTAIVDKVEYPLLMIEFSNAVFTEDHELQRFDGLVAAAESNCIYVKISPITKKSQSEHGGNVDFDYLGPFSLILKRFKKVFFHFDWNCDERGIVLVDKNYPSCPNQITAFYKLLEYLMKSISINGYESNKWIGNFEEIIFADRYFKEWKNKLEKFGFPDIKSLNTSRTEWVDSRKEFVLKLNRFGHAMDPERGMLSYYGTFYDKTASKMLFSEDNNAWYKDIPKEKEIEHHIEKFGLKTGYDYLYCFMLGSGLYNNNDFKRIVSRYVKNKESKMEIDLTEFLNKNYISLSKAMRTIFKNSVYFYITNDNSEVKVKLFWNHFNNGKDYSELPDITNIVERKYFDEDDVTYITVHNILKKNGYVLLAVSYPGAQADRVVLIAPGTGRRQQRRYIDIISYLPKKYTNLQENKGAYSPTEIQNEIDELSKYKTEKDHIEAIGSFIDRFDKNAPKVVKIGIGFWANSKFNISKVKELDIRKLDYFVYLAPDRKEWFIWSTGKGYMFGKTKGKIDIPLTFEIIKDTDENKSQSLKNFW